MDRLPQGIVFVNKSEKYTYYHLTDHGLKWLGEKLHIKIYNEER